MVSSTSPYQKAAQLLNELDKQNASSLKSLVYDKQGNLTCSKATYAQVCHVLSHQSILNVILQKVPLPAKNQGLLYVLIYELLLGPNKAIRGGGALKRKILEKQDQLQEALQEIRNNGSIPEQVHFPRYVRVNTLKTTTKEVVERLQKLDIPCYLDPHIPDLLVLPMQATRNIQQDAWFSSRIVLQDKSSCFSAYCLVHGYNKSTLQNYNSLDACAAPGNKTSHLAALLTQHHHHSNNKKATTIIHALDRSSKRVKLLERRMNELVPDDNANVIVRPLCQDFLKAQPCDYPNVTCILLDPSCSGSGIYTAIDRHNDDEDMDEDRIQHLSNFQVTVLQHAMSFESVQRIVYSTCSLYQKENEDVVAQALESNREAWELVAPHCLEKWTRRGVQVKGLSEQESASLIRVDKNDDTNGFFVGCFQRKGQRAAKHKLPCRRPKDVDIPFYNGEFAHDDEESKITKKDDASSHKKRQHSVNAKDSDGSSSAKVTKKQRKECRDNGEDVSEKSRPSTTTSLAVSDKPLPKKIAKKLAWKRRQKEQKLERLKKKK